jgi:hypothetical protein
MNTNAELIKQGIVRFLSVAGFIIGIAYLIYHGSVFIPNRWPFQFILSGIAISLSYAIFSLKKNKEAIAVLVLYFIISSGFIKEHRTWNIVLEGTYICIMACAVYLYLFIIRKQYFTHRIMDIVTAGVIIGVSNSLIILVLVLYHPLSFFARLPMLIEVAYLNLKIGTVMGLLFGIGTELSQYIISSYFTQKQLPTPK